MKAIKRYAFADHLVNNQSYAGIFNLVKFKIIKSCCIVFDFIKMDAMCIF